MVEFNALDKKNHSQVFADLEMDHPLLSYLSDSSSSLSSVNRSAELAGPTAMSSRISRKQFHSQTSNHLKLLNINTPSINSKKADLLSIIAQSQPDIIVATETWLTSTVMSSDILLPNDVAYRKDRSDGYGGVIIVIKSDSISEITSVRPNSQIEAIFVKISLLDKQTLIIGGLYRPPKNDTAYSTDLTEHPQTCFSN